MSVYESQRDVSALEFYNTAAGIRIEVTRIVRKAVPKTGRLYFALPAAETARSLVNHVITGAEFYPNSDQNVQNRRYYYTLAIADCRILQEDMKAMKHLVAEVSASTFANVIAEIEKEIALLKSARKNTRLIK